MTQLEFDSGDNPSEKKRVILLFLRSAVVIEYCLKIMFNTEILL